MRYFWKLYYLFRKPKYKTEMMIAYCRMNGITAKKIRLYSYAEAGDLTGLPKLGDSK